MAITFACSCGKQMQAKEEFAGRRMKCPACQQVVAIPGPSGPPPLPAAVAAAPPPMPAGAPRLIRFSCSCGKLLQADASKIGRPLRCPTCSTLMTVPATEEAVPVAASLEKPFLAREVRAESSPWVDRSLEQQVTPWRGDDARRFGAGDWEARDRRPQGGLLVLLALLLFAGAALAVWNYLPQGPAHVRSEASGTVAPNESWNKYSDLDLLPRDSSGLVSVRVADLWASKTGREMRGLLAPPGKLEDQVKELTGLLPAEVERVTLLMPRASFGRVPEPQSMLLFVATTQPYDQARVRTTLAGPDAKATIAGPRPAFPLLRNADALVAFPTDRVLVVGIGHRVRDLLGRRPDPQAKGPLDEALRAAQKHVLVASQLVEGPKPVPGPDPLLVEQNKPLSQRFAEVAPPPLQSLLPLLDFSQALLTVDIGEELVLQGRLTYSKEEQGQAARQGLEKEIATARILLAAAHQEGVAKEGPKRTIASLAGLSVGIPAAALAGPLDVLSTLLMPKVVSDQAPEEGHAASKQTAALVDLAEKCLDGLKVAGEGKELHLTFRADPKALTRAVGLMIPAVQPVREASLRMVIQNNLKQLALAMHDYRSNEGSFPPATFHNGLSWRVALLPYLEQAALYKQFKLEEPWNSPHNLKLLDKMPRVFAAADPDKALNATHWQVFVGGGAAFESNRGVRIGEFQDGLSNTVLIVEAARAVPWTKPEDLPYDPKAALPALGGSVPGAFLAALADGSVRPIPLKVGEDGIRALITRAGGEILELPPIGPPAPRRPGQSKKTGPP